jgi:hypothetical protein
VCVCVVWIALCIAGAVRGACVFEILSSSITFES